MRFQHPQFPPRNLCSLVMLAVSSLVYAATDATFCQSVIPLGLAESRILLAAPVDTRPRTPLISFCTIQLRTFCAGHSYVDSLYNQQQQVKIKMLVSPSGVLDFKSLQLICKPITVINFAINCDKFQSLKLIDLLT